MGAIDSGRQLATERGRPDLDQHLGEARKRLSAQPVEVVILGAFKNGKSSLVNALLQREICPVDADLVTAVPTSVRYADKPSLKSYTLTDDGERVEERELPLGSLPQLVTERADPADQRRQRYAEVGVPHRMLRSGMVLVDTPGVGGLDSAHGFLALGALRRAQGVCFVTTAAQELTGAELDFLRTAVGRCSRVAVVVTKVDLYPEADKIADLTRGHLEDAGLGKLPVIKVSSLLRMEAKRDPGLNEESGFAELVEFLARDVVAACREGAAQSAAAEVDFVAAQLEQQTTAERAIIEAPELGSKVVAELEVVQQQARRLAAKSATWQQTLGDGIQDLFSDVQHDLQQRFREVLRHAEEVIDAGDPKETWEETQVWLSREVAKVALANRDLLEDRARQLTESVAADFDLPTGTGFTLRLGAADHVALVPASPLVAPGGRLSSLLIAARSSYYLPMMAGSVVAGFMGLQGVEHLAITGVAALLGTGIGQKIFKDERTRQRTFRQQQAKASLRKYIEDVSFVLNKQSQDELRSTQRQLRDEFQDRAVLLARSATAASESARRVSELGPAARREHHRELARQRDQLGQLRQTVADVARDAA